MTTKRSSGQFELILENRQLVFIFFGAVLLCAIFFALGFLIGRDQRDFGWLAGAAKPDNAPVAESAPKTGAQREAASPTATSKSSDQTAIDKELTFYKTVEGKPAAEDMKVTPAKETAASNPPSAPARSAVAGESRGSAAANSSAAGNSILFQVAALSKPMEAEAMVRKLKSQGFQAFLVSPPPDSSAPKLYRVQIGPFADAKVADRIKSKLVAEGYSPILKK